MDKIILPNPKDYEPIPVSDILQMFVSLKKINDKQERKRKARERMEKLEQMRLDRLEIK
jgi:hypothetical protein